MLQILDLCRWEDLESYRASWDALCDRSGELNPWASLHWLKAAHAAQPGVVFPRALLAFDGSQLVGVVPLLGERHGNAWSWKTPNPFGSSAAPAGSQPTATLCAAFDYLSRCDSTWSSVVWSHVAGGSGLLARLRSSALHARLSLVEHLEREQAIVELSAGSEAYWNSRPGGLRSNLSRQFAVLFAQQRLQFDLIAGDRAAVAMPESDPLAQSLLHDSAADRVPVAATMHLDGRLVASAWGVRQADREHLFGFANHSEDNEDLPAIFWRQWISHSFDAGVRSVQGDVAWQGLAGFATKRTVEHEVHLRGPASEYDGWWRRLRAWVGDLREAAHVPQGLPESRCAGEGSPIAGRQAAASAKSQPSLKVVAHDDLLDALPAATPARQRIGRPQLALWNQSAAEQPVEG